MAKVISENVNKFFIYISGSAGSIGGFFRKMKPGQLAKTSRMVSYGILELLALMGVLALTRLRRWGSAAARAAPLGP
ncbi:hypothetical protein ACXYUI_31880, partial [Klebsiella pneumoniae]